MTWHNMNTAPKDGTHFIAYRPTADDKLIKRVGEEYWLDGKHIGQSWANSSQRTPPTMWQPMPSPPKPNIVVSVKEEAEISNIESIMRKNILGRDDNEDLSNAIRAAAVELHNWVKNMVTGARRQDITSEPIIEANEEFGMHVNRLLGGKKDEREI